MDSGYWQLVAEEVAREIMASFTSYGKWWCKVMPMGALNAAPAFVAMMTKLQMEWDTLSK